MTWANNNTEFVNVKFKAFLKYNAQAGLFTEMGKTVLKLQIDSFDEKIGVLVFCTYELRQPF